MTRRIRRVVAVTGIGGRSLAEEAGLRYPGWEVEYRLKLIREFDTSEQVFLSRRRRRTRACTIWKRICKEAIDVTATS
jgi:hypothetical protein